MKARLLVLVSSSLAFVVIACSSGGSSSSSSSSGETSSSSGDPGDGDAGVCTELHLGGKNDPLGGSNTSEVSAQVASDLYGATGTQLEAITTACKTFATALDVAAADQAAADGKTEPREKTEAWCQLAVKQISETKATAGGLLSVTYDPPACKLSVQQKAECQGRCIGSACDSAANPMTCTGGKLEGGFCVGGKLEGGCKTEARCDASCDVSVIASADCPKPSVSAETPGNGDASAAAKLKAAVEANLPAVLALKAQCELESNVGPSFIGSIATVTDIKPACIPPLVKGTKDADENLKACFVAASAVVGVAQ